MKPIPTLLIIFASFCLVEAFTPGLKVNDMSWGLTTPPLPVYHPAMGVDRILAVAEAAAASYVIGAAVARWKTGNKTLTLASTLLLVPLLLRRLNTYLASGVTSTVYDYGGGVAAVTVVIECAGTVCSPVPVLLAATIAAGSIIVSILERRR